MIIERNLAISSPTNSEIITSGLFDNTMQPIEAYSQRNTDLTDSKNVTRGYLCILNQGLVFLALESNVKNFTETDIADALVSGMVAQFSFLGGLVCHAISYVALGTILENKNIKNCYNHPDTYLIPYVEIFKAEHVSKKAFSGKQQDYLIIGRQISTDDYQEYAIRPCDSGYVDLMFVIRFGREKEALLNKYIDEKFGFINICESVSTKYSAKYGPNWAASNTDQFMNECKEILDAKLKGAGLTYQQMDAEIKESLSYFRSFPMLAEYFNNKQ